MCSCGCELAIVLAEARAGVPARVGSGRDLPTVHDRSRPVTIAAAGWIARLVTGLVPGWRATR